MKARFSWTVRISTSMHGSRQYGMKAIVETLANDKVKKFYEKNKHSALGDAETLCRLSNSKAMHDRFRS